MLARAKVLWLLAAVFCRQFKWSSIFSSLENCGRSKPLCTLTLSTVILAFSIQSTNAQETILFSTNFEANDGGFTHSGVLDQWEWGTPVFGDGVTPHSGSRVWATKLDGRMAFNHNGNLYSPAICLPPITPTQRIYVSFFCLTKLDCMSDRATFYVSSNSTTWEEISDLFNTMEMGVDEYGNPLETGNAEWHKYVFDVSHYAGGDLFLRFEARDHEGFDYWYGCPPHDMAGVYLDDVAVTLTDGVFNTVEFTVEGYEDPSDYASCPWLLVWNGDDWVQENDIYSTARFPRNEFTDYMSIERVGLVENSGTYLLKISELNEEHSYTDWVSLLVIDHPVGTNVGCDDIGMIHTYNNPVAPAIATDQYGTDVLNLVGNLDGIPFIGFDGYYIDLDFSNIFITDAAKLVLNITGFEADSTITPEMHPFTVRRGVYIQTRNEYGEWTQRGYFNPRWLASTKVYDLGPFLPDPFGNNHVRLAFVSCHTHKYHALDYVGMDISGNIDVDHWTLSPSVAVHTTAGDVKDIINFPDGDYALTNPGEEIFLTFEAPLQTLENRSFVFVAKGYYIVPKGTYFFFTWDGSNWILRDGKSFKTPVGVDETNVFDLSLHLPDPDGEYKVLIWQDYRYNPAALDYVGMTAGGYIGTLESAHCYQWNNIRDVTAELAYSDNIRLDFVPYQMNGRTRIVQVAFTGLPVCESIPIVQDLNIGGDESIYAISNPNPPISWSMFDAFGHYQEEFAVQVWTGPGATGENLWYYSEISSATEVIYNGAILLPGGTYFLRLRVRDSEEATCWSAWSEIAFRMYCEDCNPPQIIRTPETVALSSTSQPAYMPLTIEAWITDDTAVYEAVLFYRTTGTPTYFTVAMNNLYDALYSAQIPGGVVDNPGVDYYIWASDGMTSATCPQTNPAAWPHQIAVVPNQAPEITHEPVVEALCGTSILIQATVEDETNYVAQVRLHYRIPGEFVYSIVGMTHVGSGVYQGTIPATQTIGVAVEYYISAADDYGVSSYAGSFDAPYVISLSGNCNEPPEVVSITVSPGDPCQVESLTPTFTWDYYDPEGQVQSHYMVEVRSEQDGAGAVLWSPPVFSGDASSIEYAGSALLGGYCYYFRIRVRDGVLWSEWSELRFCYSDLALEPSSVTLNIGETSIFTASGGPQPYIFTLTNPEIGELVSVNDSEVRFNAISGGNSLLVVTDDCGITAESLISVLSGAPDCVIATLGDPEFDIATQHLVVPIELQGVGAFGPITGIDVVFTFDPAVLMSPQASFTGTLLSGLGWSFMWNEPQPGEFRIGLAGTQPLPGDGVLAYLKLDVVPGAPCDGCSALAIDLLLNEGDPCVHIIETPDWCLPLASVTGLVSYWGCGMVGNDYPPIPDVRLAFFNSCHQDTAWTDPSGVFVVEACFDSCYTLEPWKAGGEIIGISTLDAAVVLRHVVGLDNLEACPINPMQMQDGTMCPTDAVYPQQLAADVTGNGAITSYDASKILQYIVGADVSETLVGQWEFFCSDRTVCVNAETVAGMDFTGLLYGDVTGNYRVDPTRDTPAASAAHIQLVSVVSEPGSTVDVPLMITNADGFYGLKLQISHAASEAVVEGVMLGALAPNRMLAWHYEDGQLNVALAGAAPLMGNGELMRVRYRINDDIQVSEISLEIADVYVDENPTPLTADDGVIALQVTSVEQVNIPSTFRLYAAVPNPFNPMTTIAFDMPRSGNAVLAVYDLAGRQVRVLHSGELIAGRHEFTWYGLNAADQSMPSGTYLCRLQAADYSSSVKITLVK